MYEFVIFLAKSSEFLGPKSKIESVRVSDSHIDKTGVIQVSGACFLFIDIQIISL